ncbi:hypothetical protein A8C32_13895 [Flavivirga aquatica]|uniref:DUF4302 domain-containing protein n=1 Tax=Flavivirga aquatica TaxID=1849968 RepID=A0A1E5TC91_9FLAO|nr:DUF4302 domain-containing protein [Flavivirga aquatica]OEK08985.1 hypothetical protein A8C32_13895 [Flavivirga aquatica]
MKKIFNLIGKINLLILLILAASCTDNEVEPLFDQSINERTEVLKEEYLDLLAAPDNGWIGYYSPNEDTGLFTVLMNFDENGDVSVKSGYRGGAENKNITYRLDKTLKIELVFESHTVFHSIFEINNNNNKGEFVFNILSATEDEIILESKLDFGDDVTVFTLRRALESEVDLETLYKSLDALTGGPTESVFRNILLNDKAIATFDFNPNTRFATITYIKNGSLQSEVVRLIVTNTGFNFPTPVDVNGTILTSFTYNELENEFQNETEKLRILYDDIPGLLLNPYDFGNEGGNIRILRTNEGFLSRDRSSTAFVSFFEGWRSDFATNIGFSISRVYIRNINTATPFLDIYIPVSGGDARARFDCTYTLEQGIVGNNIVKFTFNETSPNNLDFGLAPSFAPITDFIFRDSGFYIQKMEPLNASQNTIGLIPVDDTSMLVQWYDF